MFEVLVPHFSVQTTMWSNNYKHNQSPKVAPVNITIDVTMYKRVICQTIHEPHYLTKSFYVLNAMQTGSGAQKESNQQQQGRAIPQVKINTQNLL